MLNALGADDVKTYIQSGNVVFQSKPEIVTDLARKLGVEIRDRHGFEPNILILNRSEFEKAMADNPFPKAEAEPRSLHLGFLASTPEAPDLNKLESLKKDSEQFRLMGRVFYLHTPEGLGRSKLAARAEKLLGVSMTYRNWNTVYKLKEMAMEG